MSNWTVASNVTRILRLRRLGWSERALAKYLVLPIGVVRTVLIEHEDELPKKMQLARFAEFAA